VDPLPFQHGPGRHALHVDQVRPPAGQPGRDPVEMEQSVHDIGTGPPQGQRRAREVGDGLLALSDPQPGGPQRPLPHHPPAGTVDRPLPRRRRRGHDGDLVPGPDEPLTQVGEQPLTAPLDPRPAPRIGEGQPQFAAQVEQNGCRYSILGL